MSRSGYNNAFGRANYLNYFVESPFLALVIFMTYSELLRSNHESGFAF